MSDPPYDPARLRQVAGEIVSAARELAARGWTPATSSNFSMRLDEAHAAITVSGGTGVQRQRGGRARALECGVRTVSLALPAFLMVPARGPAASRPPPTLRAGERSLAVALNRRR